MSGSSSGNHAAAAAAAAAAASVTAAGNGVAAGGGAGHNGGSAAPGNGGGVSGDPVVVGAGLPALGTGVSSNPSSPQLQPRQLQQHDRPPEARVPQAARLPSITSRRVPQAAPMSIQSSFDVGTPLSSSLPINNLNHLDGGSGLGSISTFSDDLSEDPNAPAKHDFMVSFLVDARGGSMIGCRHSGAKVGS